ADRIRGIKAWRVASEPRLAQERAAAPRESAIAKGQQHIEGTRPKPEPWNVTLKPHVQRAMSEEVIAALVAAGYKKATASEAAFLCTENERASIESWTRAALRNCAQGASS